MSLVEMLLSMGLFGVLTLGASQALRLLASDRDTSSAEAALCSSAFDAVQEIAGDIRLAGDTEDGLYPHLVDDPENPGADYDAHVHAPATVFATANREVIFVHAADVDDNNVPDVQSDGSLTWSTQEVSYVLVPGIEGRNQIERRIDGAFDRVITRNVESMTFDDSLTSGGVVPSGCLRVILVMSIDSNGQTLRRQVERIVHLVQDID